ncbi:hypothetical protein SAMN02745163_01781 [Clostridium cavendishii DSM 21758]|uniref:Uncharacterized protein n=1 Tax=Clostridium cavendishii DSM 21758 TaxID=1121302 RepID=A0A1M6IPZ0_9CLOT|nr:hypothetical protein [Clostridium cavendishii]SHJ36497.1 hypothetical protein SAMN02745163_01781 [Clostridium cavendishii DSM 21758]
MTIKKLSTGVLAKDVTTTLAGITLVNVDSDDSANVSVFVFDWTSGSPVQLTTSIPNPVIILPDTFQNITASLSSVSFYEIRFVYTFDNDIIFNCYGLTALPFVIGQANNVLHRELSDVELV